MDKMIKVEPVAGRLVRVPATGRELKEPTKVPADSFWLRRIGDGDVRRVESEKDGTK